MIFCEVIICSSVDRYRSRGNCCVRLHASQTSLLMMAEAVAPNWQYPTTELHTVMSEQNVNVCFPVTALQVALTLRTKISPAHIHVGHPNHLSSVTLQCMSVSADCWRSYKVSVWWINEYGESVQWLWQDKTKVPWKKPCPSAPLPMTNPMWMGSNLALSGDRLATNWSGRAFDTWAGTAQLL
jgi:hypothetical protein